MTKTNAMQDLKYSLKSSMLNMKSGEGDEDNTYHIIYKDGTGIIFKESECEYLKLIKLNNIAYIDLQTGCGHYNSIHGETFEMYSEMSAFEIEEFETFIENCIDRELNKYGLQYYREVNNQRKYDTIKYITLEV